MIPADRQEHQLYLIEAALRRSDRHLVTMFGIFSRLYIGEGMPAGEQATPSRDRFLPAGWITAVFMTVAVAFSAALGTASALLTVRRRARRPAGFRS
jgi:ABC-type sugar transport system permease subunit